MQHVRAHEEAIVRTAHARRAACQAAREEARARLSAAGDAEPAVRWAIHEVMHEVRDTCEEVSQYVIASVKPTHPVRGADADAEFFEYNVTKPVGYFVTSEHSDRAILKENWNASHDDCAEYVVFPYARTTKGAVLKGTVGGVNDQRFRMAPPEDKRAVASCVCTPCAARIVDDAPRPSGACRKMMHWTVDRASAEEMLTAADGGAPVTTTLCPPGYAWVWVYEPAWAARVFLWNVTAKCAAGSEVDVDDDEACFHAASSGILPPPPPPPPQYAGVRAPREQREDVPHTSAPDVTHDDTATENLSADDLLSRPFYTLSTQF